MKVTDPAPTPPAPSIARRWFEYVSDGRVFCGPRGGIGHHMPARFDIPEFGFVRCNHWLAAEKRECGRWIFLYAVRGGKCVVAEVSLDEKETMRKLATPAQMIEYLGIFAP